ncbi:MAG: MerC domain-containing protein [Flammeovirgaceae bacterium]
MEKTQKINLDILGFWASTLCAVHCAALPLLLTFSTLGSLEFLESPVVEGVMLIIAAGLALLSIIPSYFQKHHKVLPLLLIILGFALIAWGRVTSVEALEAINTVIGGLLIAIAHLVNTHFLKKTESLYVSKP